MNTPAATSTNVSLWSGDLLLLKTGTFILTVANLLIQSLVAAVATPNSRRIYHKPASPWGISPLSVLHADDAALIQIP